jgi:hypothetical protein
MDSYYERKKAQHGWETAKAKPNDLLRAAKRLRKATRRYDNEAETAKAWERWTALPEDLRDEVLTDDLTDDPDAIAKPTPRKPAPNGYRPSPVWCRPYRTFSDDPSRRKGRNADYDQIVDQKAKAGTRKLIGMHQHQRYIAIEASHTVRKLTTNPDQVEVCKWCNAPLALPRDDDGYVIRKPGGQTWYCSAEHRRATENARKRARRAARGHKDPVLPKSWDKVDGVRWFDPCPDCGKRCGNHTDRGGAWTYRPKVGDQVRLDQLTGTAWRISHAERDYDPSKRRNGSLRVREYGNFDLSGDRPYDWESMYSDPVAVSTKATVGPQARTGLLDPNDFALYPKSRVVNTNTFRNKV